MVHLFFPTFFFCIEVFLLLLERGINLVCAVFCFFFYFYFFVSAAEQAVGKAKCSRRSRDFKEWLFFFPIFHCCRRVF